jgi:CheY-like chemotaxis protein
MNTAEKKPIDKRPSILLIEDDDEISSILAELMESWGYQVVKAQTLPSALIKVNNQKFNIIILDLILKKVSGIKLLEQIRRNSNSMNNATPIILHSGNLETDLFSRYKGEINDALVKPSPNDLIKEKLAFWVDKKHVSPNHKFAFVKDTLTKREAM